MVGSYRSPGIEVVHFDMDDFSAYIDTIFQKNIT